MRRKKEPACLVCGCTSAKFCMSFGTGEETKYLSDSEVNDEDLKRYKK